MNEQVEEMGASTTSPLPEAVVSDSNDASAAAVELHQSFQNLKIDSALKIDTALKIDDTEKNDDADTSTGFDEEFKQVDQFLLQALRNPRDRINILRMELEIQRFMLNHCQQKFEFEHLPTSYLRLAAHRVAQHYGLQTMVADWNSPDGSGTRIVALKTSETKMPSVRLVDVPVCPPQEKTDIVRFAIKPRPQRGSSENSLNGHHNVNHLKSVEERNVDYIRARARIFNTNDHDTVDYPSIDVSVKPHQDCSDQASISQEEKHCESELNNKSKSKSDQVTIKKAVVKSERQISSSGRISNNRVAIFRDREKDRYDPDYDRSYDRLCRYAKSFDQGTGFCMEPLEMQAFYNPFGQYNVEYPFSPLQVIDSNVDLIGQSIPSHASAPWVGPANAIGHDPANVMLGNFGAGYLNANLTHAMHLNFSQFPCPSSVMTYVYPTEYFQQSLSQYDMCSSRIHQ